MATTNHFFISYTHDDNEKLAGQNEGWVSRLHENLQSLLGKRAIIWRDQKLRGNDEFGNEIHDQLTESAGIICVLSDLYLQSEWCRREATEFCEMAKTAGLAVGNKSRIFKVVKLPVENRPKELPDEFGELTGYAFYTSKDDRAIAVDPAYGQDMVAEFNTRTAILASDITEMVRFLGATAATTVPAAARKGTVFLAVTSWDRDADRKKLEKELTGRGYAVLPDHDLPQNEDACRDEIKQLIDGCDVAIHIIGNFPAVVPSGPTQKSVDVLQNELGVQETDARGIPRLIWLPDDTTSKIPSHQDFLTQLQRDDQTQRGADVVKGDLEGFKNAVVQCLQKLEQKKSNPQPEASGSTADRSKLIYVICDKRDNDATLGLRGALFERNLEPDTPKFEGDAATIRQHNDAMLARSGMVILFYGAADTEWYKNTLVEVQKANSGARIWTYLAPEETPHKRFLLEMMKGKQVLNGMSGAVAAEDIERMLADMPKQAAAAGGQSQ